MCLEHIACLRLFVIGLFQPIVLQKLITLTLLCIVLVGNIRVVLIDLFKNIDVASSSTMCIL